MPVERIFCKATFGRTVSTDPALARGSFNFYFGGLWESTRPLQAENQRKYKLQASGGHTLNLMGSLTTCSEHNAFLESFLDSTWSVSGIIRPFCSPSTTKYYKPRQFSADSAAVSMKPQLHWLYLVLWV